MKQAETGMKVVEVCRQNGISDATFYKWREKCGGMTVSEARRLYQLEEGSSRLKRLVAEQALDIIMLKDVIGKTSEAHRQIIRTAFSVPHT